MFFLRSIAQRLMSVSTYFRSLITNIDETCCALDLQTGSFLMISRNFLKVTDIVWFFQSYFNLISVINWNHQLTINLS